MRLAVLSRRATLYSTHRFVAAAARLGHKAIVLDPLQCMPVLDTRGPAVYHKRKRLDALDAVLPRIGSSITDHGLAVVRQFEFAGVYCANRAAALQAGRDKWLTLQLLVQQGIAVPPTAVVRNAADIPQALALVGGLPAVVKKVQGAQGVGVLLAESPASLENILQTLWRLNQNVLLQGFVAESAGHDVRAVVVGGRVVAAMRRKAPAGEFRANVHRGAACEPVRLEPAYAEAALRAAAATGLAVAGVDMLESAAGPLVLEVNGSPGFEGLEGACGVDVAGAILEHVFAAAAQGAVSP
jgi:ribosomal protein S6--L-glutamate ligase